MPNYKPYNYNQDAMVVINIKGVNIKGVKPLFSFSPAPLF